MAAIFQPSVLQWLFGSGVGTNVGAWIICGVLGFAYGVFLGKRAFDKLHVKIDLHHKLERDHAEWSARQLATVARSNGVELEQHPHFDLNQPERKRAS